MNNYKLIISDVDGTLAESRQQIDEEMSKLIAEVLKTKIFCAMSGNDEFLIRKQLLPLIRRQEYDEYKFLISATSGSGLFCIRDGSLFRIYKEKLTLKEKRKIYEIIETIHKRFTYNFNMIMENDSLTQDRDTQITLSCLGHKAPTELKKKYDSDGKKRLEMISWIKHNKKLDTSGLSIRIGGTTSIDFTRAGVNKKYGVKLVLEFMNKQYPKISRDEVIFFGDKTYKQGNDYIENYVRTIQIDSITQMKEYLRKLISGESI